MGGTLKGSHFDMFACKKSVFCEIYKKQRINGPVNAHLISGPTVSTKTSFAKFEFVLKWVKVNSGSSFILTL